MRVKVRCPHGICPVILLCCLVFITETYGRGITERANRLESHETGALKEHHKKKHLDQASKERTRCTDCVEKEEQNDGRQRGHRGTLQTEPVAKQKRHQRPEETGKPEDATRERQYRKSLRRAEEHQLQITRPPTTFYDKLKHDASYGSPKRKRPRSKKRKHGGSKRSGNDDSPMLNMTNDMAQKDPHLDGRDSYADDPRISRRRPLLSPPGARRLEQRLRPDLRTSTHNLLGAMQNIMRAFRHRIAEVKRDYQYVFNTTRQKVIMHVREELTHINQENDKIYDVVLDVSLLTKYFYKKAHEKNLKGPSVITVDRPDYADIPTRNFRPQLEKVHETNGKVDRLKYRADGLSRKCDQQDVHADDMKSRMKNRVPRGELEDLAYISNKTIRKIEGIPGVTLKKKVHMLKNLQNGAIDNLSEAKGLTRKSQESLYEAKKKYMKNRQAKEHILDARRQKAVVTASKIPPDGTQSDQPRPEEITEVRAYIKKASVHAQKLDELLALINRTLLPATKKGQGIIKSSGDSISSTVMRKIMYRAMEDIKKLQRVLDRLRILIGDEDELRSRCEELEDGSGFWQDDKTPIDCDEFWEASGSGAEMTSLPTAQQSKVTTTEVPVDTAKDEDDGFEFTDISSWSLFSDAPARQRAQVFAEKLAIYIGNILKESERLEKLSSKTDADIKDKSKRWQLVKSRVQILEEKRNEMKAFFESWKREKAFIDHVKERVRTVSENVGYMHGLIGNKSKEAISVMEKKLKSMEIEVPSKFATDAPADSPNINDVTQAEEAVAKSRRNVDSIYELKKILPDPCKKVQDHSSWLQSNITELKKKIDRARLLASSIQTTVALSGSGFLSVPVSRSHSSKSVTTQVDLCIKPQTGNAPLVTIVANDTAIYSLALESHKPVMTILNSDGDKLDTLEIPTSLEEEHWYKISFSRLGQTLVMALLSLSNSSDVEPEEANVTVEKLTSIQPDPNTLYIGGGPDSIQILSGAPSWKGCIADMMLNGRNVGLMRMDSSGVAPKICSSNCPAPSKASIVLDGDGYAKFPLNVIGPSLRVESILISFQTKQRSGLLFLLKNLRQRVQLSVSLTEGHILLAAHMARGTTFTRSSGDTYDIGTHTIQINIRHDRIQVSSDSGEEEFIQESSTLDTLRGLKDGVYLGGLGSPDHSQHEAYRSLSGCVSRLEINSQDVPLSVMDDGRSVYLGSCSQNIWSRCINFTAVSTPFTLPDFDDASVVRFVISRFARGPVVHYKRGDKFSLDIDVDEMGLTVTEYVKDVTYRVNMDPQKGDDWIIVSIEDDTKGLMDITANGGKASLPYETGYKWWAPWEKDESKYEVTVGGSLEDADKKFTGGMANLLINSNLIDLQQYIPTHSLGSCAKPHVTVAVPVPDVKPVC